AGPDYDVTDGDNAYQPANITTVTVQPFQGSGAPFDAVYSSVIAHNSSVAVGDADEIHAGSGDDLVAAQGGDDTVWGDDGNDTISGDEGDDVIFGGHGNAAIAADP